MKSPTTALVWEIWQRGRRSALLVLGCVSLCAVVNQCIVERVSNEARASFSPFFGMLMLLSFLLLMGIFNYTEFSSTKEWHGFPYRLFVLPVLTLKLVALPMFLGVASVELIYIAWIKLVWTHEQIVMPEWFAVVLGAYVVF
jgi:branched-subunit amino acid transport protein AzlD